MTKKARRRFIEPIFAIRKGKWRRQFTPRDMEMMPFDKETSITMQKISSDIFTDCVNAGTTFQEALAAVYLSGLHHGVSAKEE